MPSAGAVRQLGDERLQAGTVTLHDRPGKGTAAPSTISRRQPTMLTLCGFAASNYYNKVKLALLEKGVPFEEELAWLGQTDPAASPLGKVPYLKTDDGPLSESTVLLEYIEAKYPAHPLLPADPFAAAKVRELLRYTELHLELVARNLYPEAFFGGKVSDAAKEKTGQQLEKNIAAFARLAKFAPFLAGDTFTLADCGGAVHLQLVASATKIIYGRDYLAELPVRDYLKRLGERPTVQKVNADRKTNTELMLANVRAKAQAKG
jgi:glutathione S-transferase